MSGAEFSEVVQCGGGTRMCGMYFNEGGRKWREPLLPQRDRERGEVGRGQRKIAHIPLAADGGMDVKLGCGRPLRRTESCCRSTTQGSEGMMRTTFMWSQMWSIIVTIAAHPYLEYCV